MRLIFLLTITAAAHNIRTLIAYSIPNRLSTTALLGTRKRGVEIQIIVPSEYNDEGFCALNVAFALR